MKFAATLRDLESGNEPRWGHALEQYVDLLKHLARWERTAKRLAKSPCGLDQHDAQIIRQVLGTQEKKAQPATACRGGHKCGSYYGYQLGGRCAACVGAFRLYHRERDQKRRQVLGVKP